MLDRLRPPPGARKKRKRVGRGIGSGHGKTSGKGHKGQNARSGPGVGRGFEGGQMPLYRRLPKRGFTPRRRRTYAIVNLRDLKAFPEDTVVTPQLLRERGLVRERDVPVKILGDLPEGEEWTLRLVVQAHAFSASARERIERAGGKAEVV